MELMAGEVDSTLFAIPEAWRPYIDDPHRKRSCGKWSGEAETCRDQEESTHHGARLRANR